MIKRISVLLFIIIFSSHLPTAIWGQRSDDIRFRSSSATIELGDTLLLSWEIKKAKHVELTGIADSLPLFGSIPVIPDTNTRYELKVTINNRKEVTKRRRIKVVIPEIEYFNVPDSATDEEDITVAWRTENTQFVKISGVQDSFPSFGKTQIRMDTSGTVTLYAHGKFNVDSISDTLFIRIIEDFNVSKKLLYRGDTLNIKWKTKLSNGVRIEGMDSLFSPIGELILQPKENTNYRVFVERRYGATELFAGFDVKVQEPFISYFWGDNSMLKGDEAMLSWSVNGGEKISIDGIPAHLPRKGSKTVRPDESATYTLRVKDGARELTQDWTVKVYPFRKYISSTRHISQINPNERLDMDILSIDREKYPDEIVLRAIVVDTAGYYISGLAGPDSSGYSFGNFFSKVSETVNNKNSARQFKVKEIQETASKPYDIALVLDYSGSMQGTISYLEKAVETFVKQKYLNDRISITKFDQKIATEVALSGDIQAILKQMEFSQLRGYGGQTALYAGADEGLRNIDSTQQHKVLILFTDGNENSSFQYFGQLAVTANQLAHRLRETNTKLFIVSYGTGTNTDLLLELASLCDGKTYFIHSPENITRVFNEMPRVLHQYYEFRFKPIESPGKHRVFVNFNTTPQKPGSVFTDYFIGDNFTIAEQEFAEDNYWYREIDGKKPVSSPQVAVNFVFNENHIREEYLKNLEKFLHYLESFPDTELDILAHADHVGTAEQCLIIAEQRASAVKQYFIERGIQGNRIHTRAFGKQYPLWPEENQDWQSSENRRVELILLE